MKKLELTPEQKREIENCLKTGKSLPDKYRFLLFDDDRQVELLWQDKNSNVTRNVLPFQYIEHLDEPRTDINPEKATLDNFDISGRQVKGWTNKLIWGDNKLVLASLLRGPMRDEIEKQGGIKLIYIDPPFDVGADFSADIELGDHKITKEASGLEELAYRDTWGKGADSFIAMLYERLRLMKDLLAEDGSIYVHCDWRVSAYIRLIMDEIFGKDNFRNDIIWHYKRWSTKSTRYQRMHDIILFYSKTSTMYWANPYQPFSDKTEIAKFARKRDDRGKSVQDKSVIMEKDVDKGVPMHDVWEIPFLHPVSKERTGYPTQKPVSLLDRIIKASSKEGDIVADFFCGSGTTLEASERLGRKWIGGDLGKFAIHTTRKRMIGAQRDLKDNDKNYRAFEILNLGKYERYHYIGIRRYGGKVNEEISKRKAAEYVELIMQAYRAEAVDGLQTIHCKKNDRFVVVGPIDLPISRGYVDEVIKEALSKKLTKIDLLSFEYEMGLFPRVQKDAADKGIDLVAKYIPKDVFDKRAVENNQVLFYEVPSVVASAKYSKGNIVVTLESFACFYTDEKIAKIGENLATGKSKIVLDSGNLYTLIKDEYGNMRKEKITDKWTDWVDYWSVDFDYESRPEIIKVWKEGIDNIEDSAFDFNKKDTVTESNTGNFIFENEWQSFRTKEETELTLKAVRSAEQIKKGQKVAVKVIDIFGNDTTRVYEIEQ